MTEPFVLHRGDCIEVLRTLPDNSVDSIVTDPPYGLSKEPDMLEVLRHWLAGDDYKHTGSGFMGKSWDSFVPGPAVWREALRVLKPGGHLLAFFGSRTYDMGTLAIRIAGFDIRDQIMWLYGSGFPKSLDVSKAIDKAGGDALAWRAFSEAYAASVAASAMTHADIDRALGIKSSSCYWARMDHRGGMPPRHHWERVRELLALPAEFARLYDEAEREVIGHRDRGFAPGTNAVYGEYSGDTRVTAPATDAARQWEGWGTALKPAHEPICVARKPLVGTVAANVLEHGTGALNIDGCRVGMSEADAAYIADRIGGFNNTRSIGGNGAYSGGDTMDRAASYDATKGRWPANVIHDGSEEVLDGFPDSNGSGSARTLKRGKRDDEWGMADKPSELRDAGPGSAARFFYCPKASKADRDEGLDDMPAVHRPNGNKWTDTDYRVANGEREPGRESGPRRNIHPTVKPTALMAYLCRLVTPPGGVVLDPYMGSGSTGKAAMREGFQFIGIDKDEDENGKPLGYLDIARSRIAHELVKVEAVRAIEPKTAAQLDLLDEAAA